MKEIKDYHRKHPSTDITEAEDEEGLLRFEPEVEFSGEESMGRYLDLHELYNQFINSKFGSKTDYFEYLSTLHDFKAISNQFKLTKAYRCGFEHCLITRSMVLARY